MTQQEYQNRRQALLAKMAPGSAAIILPHQKPHAVQILNILIGRIVILAI